MSKLGIGLLYFALAGALVAGFAGYLAWDKISTGRTELISAQQQQQAAQSKATKAVADAKAATEARDQATAQLTEATSKVDDLTTRLATAQKTADEASGQITQAKADADKAKADLQHVKDVLGDMSPEDAKAALQKANDTVASITSEQKILQDQLQASQTQIASLKDAINRKDTGTMPPGINGKVTYVNRTWNFVVLSVGLSNGVVPNGELIVYRGRNFLGKIKVTSAESTTAVADILPSSKGDIQIGDDVLN